MTDSLPDRTKITGPQSAQRHRAAASQDRTAVDFPVVGIGASAGGLEACIKLFEAFPTEIGMAFILVQHLDPTHDSMMVDLLSSHTSLAVQQAIDGMTIEVDHIYVIAPATYLGASNGVIRLTAPKARRGARLPFDFLLHSLAETYGDRAACLVLSGTGADGSDGLRSINENAGLVIAQRPDDAGFDGMPQSAIVTGLVDIVIAAAEMPNALLEHFHRQPKAGANGRNHPGKAPRDWLSEIVDLIRVQTGHDFTLYKPGTLQRRIERRMTMASLGGDDQSRYVEVLRTNPSELIQLAQELLINTTSFFRDPDVFGLLEDKIIPDLVREQAAGGHIRVWVAGCSTGEEVYSLAMLFCEQIAAAPAKPRTGNIKLQVFASDVDADAVATAREGFYPLTIEAEVSAQRLARFFAKEDGGYRVLPGLRATVVFTVQDVLTDPPFSRLDLVSCRNLLIYLGVEAQARVINRLHFALKEGGLLLLGNAETAGDSKDKFKAVSKPARLYRHIGRSQPADFMFGGRRAGSDQGAPRSRPSEGRSREAVLLELCSRFLLETHAPAIVVSNRKHEYLFSVGPVDRYLHVTPGQPTNDLLSMVRKATRSKLLLAVQQASHGGARVAVSGGQRTENGHPIAFRIEVQPVLNEDEELLLICFVDEPDRGDLPAIRGGPQDSARNAELERELDVTRAELQASVLTLETSNREHKKVDADALSLNEEFQATNEELLASKEELQSLNEELTALNSQLHETLEQQRTTSNDLQNVLYSTDVATLFLDAGLKIRFFTPATKSLFNLIQGDVGRPLADLHSLAADVTLADDAHKVLQSLTLEEREIQTPDGAWFRRRISPYRTHDNDVEGVVITFNDITKRKLVAEALDIAKQQAEQANAAKSRFLAAASHDLRQPLQTLSLLQGLLAKTTDREKADKLLVRLDETLGAMSGMLNTLLDINQIEAGIVRAEPVTFQVNAMLERLKDEFTYHAQVQSLILSVVPCSLLIHSDPRLLEQMLRNLLSNALKYTRHGKVLLGCRRRAGMLNIEVWDTGVGIPDAELKAVFEEYHQIDNAARERSRGLGLGLSIVQRLGGLLGHRVRVQSRRGKGSVFAIEVALPTAGMVTLELHPTTPADKAPVTTGQEMGLVLVIEDDPEVRDLLELLLTGEGYRALAVPDGVAAMERVKQERLLPDLILADFNLPNGMNGLAITAALRERARREVPAIILTGDMSTVTSQEIEAHHCLALNKPVKPNELVKSIEKLLSPSNSEAPVHPVHPVGNGVDQDAHVIFVVDDDDRVRRAVREVLEADGQPVEDYATGEEFIGAYRPGRKACLLIDAHLPGMGGIALIKHLRDAGDPLPAILITGNSDVPMAVQAMKAGASDFIEKPIGAPDLLSSIMRALEQARDVSKLVAWRESATQHIADLTPRQREIMDLVLAGQPSKNIATDLGISQRTVENHRASLMRRTGATSLPALARLALAAAWKGTEDSGQPYRTV